MRWRDFIGTIPVSDDSVRRVIREVECQHGPLHEASSPVCHPFAQVFVNLKVHPFRTEFVRFGAIQSCDSRMNDAVGFVGSFP
jgi:hypothetical protein